MLVYRRVYYNILDTYVQQIVHLRKLACNSKNAFVGNQNMVQV